MDEQEPALSVVVPASHEEVVPPSFHRRLSATLDGRPERAAILHLDDCGDGRTRAVLLPLRAADGGVDPRELTAREMARVA